MNGSNVNGTQTKQENDMLPRILDAIPQYVYWKDLDGTYLGCNRAFAEVVGLPDTASIAGKKDGDLTWGSDGMQRLLNHDRLVMNVDLPLSGIECELQFQGAARLVEISRFPLHDAHGTIMGVLCMMEDITDQRRADAEAALRERQLVQADKMASLGFLVSEVAHEISNPNQCIALNCQSLERIWGGLEPLLQALQEEKDIFIAGLSLQDMRREVPALLTGITIGSNNIRRLVEELRHFTREQPPACHETINVNHVMQAAIRLLGCAVPKATKNLVAIYADNLPELTGNPNRLEQAFLNVVRNALQALPDPRKAIRIETGYEPEEMAIRVTVEDEGIGIAEEDMPRITEPFFTTRWESGGTGLGLSICTSILRELGGSIHFSSAPEQGTRVTMRLPVWQPQPQDQCELPV